MTHDDALELGAGLPGWTARAFVAVVVSAIIAVLAVAGLGGVAIVLLGIAGVVAVIMPASPAPALILVLVAMSVVALGGDPFAAHVLILVPLVHLLHVSCAIAGLLPADARVHLAALRAPALRFAGIQAGVFALAGLMALVPPGSRPGALEFAALLGVAAIALLIVWLLRRPQ
jgi:hypothetical protein